MAKRVLTIEIGVRYTKICEMTRDKGNPVVYNCMTFRTPKGTMEDGFIRDKATLAAILNQKLSEMKTKVSDVIFILNSTKIASREIMLPGKIKKEEKVQAIIDMQASDYFPIDISDYNISYFYMSKIQKKSTDETKNKLLLLAAPNNLLQCYINLADACGLKIIAIDYAGNSYFQIAKKQVESGVNIVIHINENTSIINIIEDDDLLLQRIIPYGTEEVIEKVKTSQVFTANNSEEAIQLLCKETLINAQFELPKDEVGIRYSVVSESYDHARQEVKEKEDITDSFRFIVNNVIRVVDYFFSKNADKKIADVYISGLGSRFNGVSYLFKNELGFDVKKMGEYYTVKFLGKCHLSVEEQIAYISCVGAGIHPVGFRLQQKKAGKAVADIKYFRYAFVFALSLTLCFTGLQFGLKTYESKRQSSLNYKIKGMNSIDTVFTNHDAAKSQYDNIKAMYELTESKNSKLHELLDELEEKLPDNMTVTTLTVNADGIALHIKSSNKISIAKMIMSLSEIKSISNITVPSIGETVEGKGSGIVTDEFDVSCQYNENMLEDDDGTDATQNPDTESNDTGAN